MQKSGACFNKRLIEWFQPYNSAHQLGYMMFQSVGYWPAGLVPSEVWFNPHWKEEIEDLMKDVPLSREGKATVDEFVRIRVIIDEINFPEYKLKLGMLADHYFVQVSYMEADVDGGGIQEQLGRKWAFPTGQSEDQIVHTCFKAILTSYEHRAREAFEYRGCRVMNPHRDMNAIVAAD